MAVSLSPVFNPDSAQVDANGKPLAGFKLFTYLAGTTTHLPTFRDSEGIIPHENPINLDANGLPPDPIFLTVGSVYKFVLAPPNDTDPPTSPKLTLHDISGIGSSGGAIQAEWVPSGFMPTFISTTSFSVPGDQRATLHVGRRVRIVVATGVVHGTIITSVFVTVTTVTIALDSGVLDTGIGLIEYGFTSYLNTSAPTLRNETTEYVLDTSIVPNIITIAPFPATLSHFLGQHFRVKLNTTNTGPTVINVNVLPIPQNVLRQNSDGLAPGDLPAGSIVDLVFDGTSYIAQSVVLVPPIQTEYILDTSVAANFIAIAPSPAITSYVAGLHFRVKLARTNTAATTMTVNALTGKSVLRQNAAALVASDLVAGNIVDLVYDGTRWIVQSVVLVPNPAVSGLVQIANLSVSNQTTIDVILTTLLPLYSRFDFEFSLYKDNVGIANLTARFSSNGGSSYLSGGTDYHSRFSVRNTDNDTAVENDVNSSVIQICTASIGEDVPALIPQMSGIAEFFPFGQLHFRTLARQTTANNWESSSGFGVAAPGGYDAIRFQSTFGVTGNIIVRGLKR